MNSQRYEILALVTHGQIAPEEAERLLAALGSKRRRAVKVIWTTVVAVLVPALLIAFHQVDHVRFLLATAVREVDRVEIFRRIHVAVSRIFDAL